VKYIGDVTDAICDVKRLYVDLVITRPCPECGEDVNLDYSQNYISYGDGNLNFYCYDGCEHEWEVEADITATVIIETKE
jgi:hypothetical protein